MCELSSTVFTQTKPFHVLTMLHVVARRKVDVLAMPCKTELDLIHLLRLDFAGTVFAALATNMLAQRGSLKYHTCQQLSVVEEQPHPQEHSACCPESRMMTSPCLN